MSYLPPGKRTSSSAVPGRGLEGAAASQATFGRQRFPGTGGRLQAERPP